MAPSPYPTLDFIPYFIHPNMDCLFRSVYIFRMIIPKEGEPHPLYNQFAVMATPNTTSMRYLNQGLRMESSSYETIEK